MLLLIVPKINDQAPKERREGEPLECSHGICLAAASGLRNVAAAIGDAVVVEETLHPLGTVKTKVSR